MKISFVIPGAAVGKGRPRATTRGKFVSMYTPEKTASYENLVKIKAQEAMAGNPPTDCACLVNIDIFVSVPASFSKKTAKEALDGTRYPTTKPDIDNVIKGIFDAMNGIVFRDDKQVVDCRIIKRYWETPEVAVAVTAIETK
jgi:Holliday junction resolvase RusA-like endonuclease